jgi:hypothetical protein
MLDSSSSGAVTNPGRELWVMGPASQMARSTSALICPVTAVSPSSARRIAASAVPTSLCPETLLSPHAQDNTVVMK